MNIPCLPALPPALRRLALLLSLTLAPQAHSATPAPSADSVVAPSSTTRFATDAAVREGMLAVRATMEEQEAAIAGKQLDAAAYTALARRLDTALQGPLSRRSLPKAAAIAFRGSIWQDLEYCMELMRAGRSVSMQRAGAFGVQQVLRNYPLYFDHPGW